MTHNSNMNSAYLQVVTFLIFIMVRFIQFKIVSIKCSYRLCDPVISLCNRYMLRKNLKSLTNSQQITCNRKISLVIQEYHLKCINITSLEGGCLWSRQASLPSSCHAKSKQYCGPYGPTSSIFYGI